jgi:hypothetical protein
LPTWCPIPTDSRWAITRNSESWLGLLRNLVTCNLGLQIPSKPLTLDLMETFDLFSTRACYHQTTSLRIKWRE